MTTLLPGPPEISYAMGNSGTKTAEGNSCPCKANSRLEKGIVSVVGGVWQLATFWCSDGGSSDPACSACGSKTGEATQ